MFYIKMNPKNEENISSNSLQHLYNNNVYRIEIKPESQVSEGIGLLPFNQIVLNLKPNGKHFSLNKIYKTFYTLITLFIALVI